MKNRLTFKTALLIIKYAVTPITCCRPQPGSSIWKVLRHNLLFWTLAINLSSTVAASLYNIYCRKHDVVRVIRIAAEMGVLLSALVKMMIVKIAGTQIQSLLGDMESFLERASHKQKELIEIHVGRCLVAHTVVFFSVIIGPSAFIFAPLMTSQLLPGDTMYPFDMEQTWVWASLYVSHISSLIQVFGIVILDLLLATILWYVGARFHILSLDLRKAVTAEDVRSCVRLHQELTRYTDKMKSIMRIFALEVSLSAGFAFIAGGFVLTRNPSQYDFAKYVAYEIAAAMELFLYSWPADNLQEVSYEVGDAAYQCDWVGKSPVMLRNVLIVIQQSRNPNVITLAGFLPVLSLASYGSTMVAAFSYLTTLRAIAV